MSKTLFKPEPVEIEFCGEKFTLQCKRVYIQSGPVNAYRELINSIPELRELDEESAQFLEIQTAIEDLEKEAKSQGKDKQETEKEILEAIGKDTLSKIVLFSIKKSRIEEQYATVIFDAKLNILVPALRGWDIEDEELALPKDDKDKKVLLQTYGELGAVVVDAMWEWYRPTTVSSVPGEKTTPKDDTTNLPSSTPATENSEKTLPNSSTTR